MKNSFIKKTMLYLISAVISALLNIVLIKVCGVFVDPYDYGIYSVIFGIYSLITQVVFMVFSQSILRFYADYDSQGKLSDFYRAYWQMFIFVGIIYLLIVLVTIPFLLLKVENYTYKLLIALFSIMFLIEGFNTITLSFARCRGMAKEETITNILDHLVKIVIFLVLFFIIMRNVGAIVVASIAGMIVSIIFKRKAWLKPKNIFSKPDKAILSEVLRFGLPIVGVPIVNYLLSTSDQFIINLICGEYDTGLYSMGYKIATSLFSLVTSFLIIAGHNVAMKKYDTESVDSASNFVRKLSLVYFMICLPLLAEVFVFSEYLLRIFASEEYLQSSFVLSISSIGIVFAGYINYTNKPWEMKKKSWMITVFSLIGAIINIILNIIFIPIYGYQVAALTTVISYFVVIVGSRLGSRKIMSLKIGSFKLIKLFLITIIMGYYLYLMNLYVVANIFQFILVAISGLIIYLVCIILFMKNDIKDILNEFKTIQY